MQRKKALQLLSAWTNRLCIHPSIVKEYQSKKETGNKVCGVCGRVIYLYAGENALHMRM